MARMCVASTCAGSGAPLADLLSAIVIKALRADLGVPQRLQRLALGIIGNARRLDGGEVGTFGGTYRQGRAARRGIDGLNAAQAALRAGYGKGNVDSARAYAGELRRKHHIGEAISALLAERHAVSRSRSHRRI
jgi:hypothetical protein